MFCDKDDISENEFFYQKEICTLELFDRLWYNHGNNHLSCETHRKRRCIHEKIYRACIHDKKMI